jgi:hypothetical protein
MSNIKLLAYRPHSSPDPQYYLLQSKLFSPDLSKDVRLRMGDASISSGADIELKVPSIGN